jgi:LytS/YehU family sensor histidine kinase
VNSYFSVINMFIEDTSVIVVVAYLLARGRMLSLLFTERRDLRSSLFLGLILGLIGLTEAVFPGKRLPYVADTLLVIFATVIGGLRVGLVAATVLSLGAALFEAPFANFTTLLTTVASALFAEGIARFFPDRRRPLSGLAIGAVAQAGAACVRFALAGGLHGPYALWHATASIAANAFGLLLLLLVVNDARIRADSERNRTAAERAHTLVAEAQLNALRARIHPHFLFNTLTSIAALCGIAPDRAEAATLRLSQLMRRALDSNLAAPLRLEEEIDYVRGYLEIEQHRFGQRLNIVWEIDSACGPAQIPGFAVQTLVENAITHGVGPQIGPGQVRIVARRFRDRALIAVIDDGQGMDTVTRTQALEAEGEREHGLRILTQQLALLHGPRARLRLFTRPDAGTLACFAVPLPRQLPLIELKGDRR